MMDIRRIGNNKYAYREYLGNSSECELNNRGEKQTRIENRANSDSNGGILNTTDTFILSPEGKRLMTAIKNLQTERNKLTNTDSSSKEQCIPNTIDRRI
jgi:hypothetical protein